MRDVGVVYLYRFAEGEHPVRRFLKSYRDHSAGIEHEFHVVFKGFPDQRRLNLGRELFSGMQINSIELEDNGYDIGSYLAAAKVVSNRRIIFLNTFSQILGRDWLRHFDRAFIAPEVGLVGATGSWLSNASGYEGALRRLFYRTKYLPTLLSYLFNRESEKIPEKISKMRKRSLRRYLQSPFSYLYNIFEFGRFPNPHIRTNSFMMERIRFLSLDFPSFKIKSEAYKFESGRRSLTRQIIRQGLRPVVVDRNGRVYDIAQWKSSATFWINDQENLLIADNRTRDYAEGDEELRDYLEDAAWVDPWLWRLTTLFPSHRS